MSTSSSQASGYVESVLDLYLRLPHTPQRFRPDDRFLAQQLRHRRIPLRTVHAALLLGSARRLFPTEPQPPLPPIRSLRYFLPVINELRFAKLDDSYLAYLRAKLARFLDQHPSCDHPLSTPQATEDHAQLSFDWS